MKAIKLEAITATTIFLVLVSMITVRQSRDIVRMMNSDYITVKEKINETIMKTVAD